MGIWGNATNFYIVLGVFITNMLGLGLPKPDTPEVYTSDYWRVVYASPYVNQAIVILCFLFVYKEDSLKFLITKREHKDALKVIKNIYTKDSDHMAIL
mmetsp:Transcript_111470/g.154045  ORF Transcript_111470/g.154045 Transcript_111470/m.154045 type:complete len:98 (+) Transcript_111470:451-744(+)